VGGEKNLKRRAGRGKITLEKFHRSVHSRCNTFTSYVSALRNVRTISHHREALNLPPFTLTNFQTLLIVFNINN
jgi:hypothetical protein